MNIRDFDLNLLTVLDTLLEEQNLSRAARRLGVNQPAVSRSLARLRELLGDPLLVRARRGMVPTQRGLALREPIRRSIEGIALALQVSESQRPERQTRSFDIVGSDYALELLLPNVIRSTIEAAPDYQIAFRPMVDDVPAALERGEFAMALLPKHKVTTALQHRKLLDDDYVCVVAQKSPLARKPLTFDALREARHVTVAMGSRGQYVADPLDAILERKHFPPRKTAATVTAFVSAVSVAASTELIATVPRRLAHRLASRLNIRLVEPPLALPGFQLCLVWHERFHNDPCHSLLRQQFALCATQEQSRTR